MILVLKLPRFGTNMEEATIAQWHKQPGEAFRNGDPLYAIETEKVTTDVAAPCDGRLTEILAGVDAVVEVGAAVCRVETA